MIAELSGVWDRAPHAASVVLLATWVGWRRQELHLPWRRVALGISVVSAMFLLGWFAATGIGFEWARFVFGFVFASLILWWLTGVIDRAANDFLGGRLFDLISEGPFREKWADTERPNLTQLYQWRDSGQPGRAVRVARRHLIQAPEAYPLWLFAAETLVLHEKEVGQAKRIICRLCRSGTFSSDEKIFALHSLRDWVSSIGASFDPTLLLARVTPSRKSRRAQSTGRFWPRMAQTMRLAVRRLLKMPAEPAHQSGAPDDALDPNNESIQDLLAKNLLGTAVARLEEYLQNNPTDYDACLLLAETWFTKCGFRKKADMVLRHIQECPSFTEEQRTEAAARFRTWKQKDVFDVGPFVMCADACPSEEPAASRPRPETSPAHRTVAQPAS